MRRATQILNALRAKYKVAADASAMLSIIRDPVVRSDPGLREQTEKLIQFFNTTDKFNPTETFMRKYFKDMPKTFTPNSRVSINYDALAKVVTRPGAIAALKAWEEVAAKHVNTGSNFEEDPAWHQLEEALASYFTKGDQLIAEIEKQIETVNAEIEANKRDIEMLPEVRTVYWLDDNPEFHEEADKDIERHHWDPARSKVEGLKDKIEPLPDPPVLPAFV